MTSEAERICSSLVSTGDGHVGARAIAECTLRLWTDIDATLSPIIGSRGVAALYSRSLYLTRSAHRCLADVSPQAGQGPFDALHDQLVRQAPTDAVAASCALVRSFCELLASLIGTSLTERLLSTVRDPTSSGSAAQDASP